MFDNYRCTAPRPDSRHATATYKGREVDIRVVQDVVQEGTYVVVAVGFEILEYVTDYAEFDAALEAGLDAARALVDEHRH